MEKYGRAWLAQLVRSLYSDHKVPGLISGFAEIRIFVFLLKLMDPRMNFQLKKIIRNLISLFCPKPLIEHFHTIPRDTRENGRSVHMLVPETKERIKILLLRIHQHGCYDVR